MCQRQNADFTVVERYVYDETSVQNYGLYIRTFGDFYNMDALLKPIEDAIGFVMSHIYSVVPSVGLSIIIVTMLVMLLLFPLTHKQTKSMLAMQLLQPKMKELQVKYKDDRQKLSEETMALYKEAGVNPLGGCLPLLVQMPFFFSMFRISRSIQNHVPEDSQLFKAICSPAKTVEVCNGNAGTFLKAGFSPAESEKLAAKLPAGSDFLGLHLSKSLIHATDEGILTIIAYLILIVAVAGTSYIAVSRSQSLNPNSSVQNPIMKYMKYFVPFMAAASPIYLPAGASLYLLTSSGWRACQQEFLYRKIIIPHHEKNNQTKDEEKVKEIEESKESYQPGKARAKRKKK